MRSQERVDEGVVKENGAVPGEVDGAVAIKKSPKDGYCKRRHAFEEFAVESKCVNPTRAFQNVPEREIEEQCPSTSGDLHVITSHPPINLESARNIEEKPTTSKKLEINEVESDLADDVVVPGSHPVPEEETEDRAAASKSDESLSDGLVQQDEIDEDIDENVVAI